MSTDSETSYEASNLFGYSEAISLSGDSKSSNEASNLSGDSVTSSTRSGDGNSVSKRSRNQEMYGTGVDRISDLPESVLLHILSFLSVIYVVRTSILSRRWQYVWTGVPCLNFGAELVRALGSREKTVNFVNKFLLQYDATSIHKFRLGYKLQDYSSDMESWIRWAINRNVQELDLSFIYHGDRDLKHHLPLTTFGCKTLVVLKLKNLYASMVFPSSACIPCLKTLELDSLRYADYMFESKLISCCVRLENLTIRKDVTGHGNDFCVHSQQLKNLKITAYQAWEYDDDCVIDINAPALEELDVRDDGLYSLSLANAGNLRKAKINLNGSKAPQSLLKCFSALKNAKSLHLSSSYTKQAYNLKPGLAVINVNLTHLTLEVGSVWVQLLHYFLHCFPNLEVLKLSKAPFVHDYAYKLCMNPKLLPAGLLPRLRVFVAGEFSGTNDELGMLKYILMNGKVLDLVQLEYTTRKRTTSREMLRVAQKILSIPRASQKCRIKFFDAESEAS